MLVHVDALDRGPRKGKRRTRDNVGFADEREDRPVMIRIAVDVEKPGAARPHGISERVDDAAVTPLADIRNAFKHGDAVRQPTA
jgi:hypothetical protein